MVNKISLFSFSLYSSIFSIFAILTISYSLNLIYLVGDKRQIVPLFMGIILGSLIYSLSASIKKVFIPGLLLSIISISVAIFIILSRSMVIDNLELFISSALVTAPLLPIVAYFSRPIEKFRMRLLFSIITCAFFIIIISIFAFLYTFSNQTILPLGISFFAYISIIFSFLLLKKENKITN